MKIRMIHHLARTGGTLICKCLATMDNVVLLSEIHPNGLKQFNPLQQFADWYDLLTEKDRQIFSQGASIGFLDAIKLINMRCNEQGKTLIIRDWTHLDYTPSPFYETPTNRLTFAETLQDMFELINFSTVRHPIDQYLSLSKLQVMQNHLAVNPYMDGCYQFARAAGETGFIRYEDFTRDPDTLLKTICDALQIEFDPNYRDRWHTYTNITGDVTGTRAQAEIKPLKRRDFEPQLLQQFMNNPNYMACCDLLGYE